MRYAFEDIFSIPTITRICQSFTELENCVTALLDLEGNVHVATGWQDICTKFHRVHEKSCARCLESDTALANQLAIGEKYNLYRCKNGLIDVAVPIFLEEEHVANFFTGQFLSEKPDEEFFIKQAETYNYDKGAYMEALSKVPIHDEIRIQKVMAFLSDLTQLIGQLGLERLKQLDAEEKRKKELEAEIEHSTHQILEQRNRYEEVIRATNVGTWEWNIQTGKTHFNERWAEIIGYSLEELEPTDINTWLAFSHPDDLETSSALLKEHFEGKNDYYECECRMKHKNGSWVWIMDRGKVVEWDENGKARRMVGAHTEVSKRKRIEFELEEARNEAILANQAKSEFLSNMSHELRTPMVGIRGVYDLLNDNPAISSVAPELLEALDTSSTTLMGVLNDVLDFSKIEAGKLELVYSPVDPAQLITSLIQLFNVAASKKGNRIKTNAKDFLGRFYLLDELRLRQIITNLLNNAVKFTENGEIEIKLEFKNLSSKKHQLFIHVNDTGIGIPKDAQKHIFERFRQADTSTTKKYGGTGLGLAICKELIALFNGEITMESEEHKGTRFTLSLPVEPTEVKSGSNTSYDLPPMRILIAEDNFVNQKVISAMLSKYGHDIDLACNGIQAVEKANVRKFDLILMDMHMPEKDGQSATQEIRSCSRKNKESLIIAFTADAISKNHEKYLKCGVNGLITKPVTLNKLLSEIYKLKSLHV